MGEEWRNAIFALLYVIGGILVVLQDKLPQLIEIVKGFSTLRAEAVKVGSKSDKGEEDSNEPTGDGEMSMVGMPGTGPLLDFATDAQSFLNEVGKSYFEQLRDDAEELKNQVSDCEEINEGLIKKMQEVYISKEEIRIERDTLRAENETMHSELSETRAERDGLRVKVSVTDISLKAYQETIESMQSQLDSLRDQNAQQKDVIASHRESERMALNQLDKCNERLNAAYETIEEERDRADNAVEQIRKLRKIEELD